ncbi:14186_t:CDS:2 [Funneliformis mosseae]|uniref:14186_t:CDS:1 n=1 Tax=Funneliformis mosseae TaxID=27381 RepID=A0A9N9GQL0_FUNMO|nr:14186_t:CDS:2 [Funneliformis mosseae]
MSTIKRKYRRKPKSLSDEEVVEDRNTSPSVEKDKEPEDVSETIEELIELRKFRRRPQGIDADKLSKGEAKAKKKKKDEDPWKLTVGGLVDLDEQTNALDVDKHMMAYIEEEMRKRRGQRSDSKNDDEIVVSSKPLNPQDELFQAPDHLRIESKPISEGNVQLSTTMLTAIPEVDLGIDVRLKNIEETEKAKRKMLEQRHQKPKDEKDTFEGSNFSATNRFYRTRPTQNQTSANKNGQRREMATDDLVAERFKKRLRR